MKILILTTALLALAGCETVAGVGRDITSAAQVVKQRL